MTINEINFLRFYKNGDLLGSNSWESFNNYKLLNAEQLKFDCDSSSQAKKLMRAIFDDDRFIDTIISPQSFVTLYMRYYYSDLLEYNARNKKYIVPDIAGLKKQMVNEGVAENVKTINNQAVWAYFAKVNDVQIHESMLEFLHAVYTLPNFSVVCRGFNVGRVAKTQDNFLVALNHIYDCFKEQEMKNLFFKPCEELDKFLSHTANLTQDEVVREVREWLTEYESFADFIEKYYLQDFLEEPNNSNSKPKELWEGIFNGNLQPSEKEFLPSIDFLTNAIKCRGNRMMEANPGL
ncbi:hypothetical protein [Bacillus paralicheniformis]|uniref:hypothetical protein n=1 Tax=Bacillus paralicheniformis TaxID=1648923 RepID=UPI001CC632F8|nr:hypothetical protein [Bacillus paralicheniformis]MBZ5216670.1 hypothetical protein [Bacillus paralicheniformis]MED1068052.1 hypothetical protein [Bacillus paralicheniformis]